MSKKRVLVDPEEKPITGDLAAMFHRNLLLFERLQQDPQGKKATVDETGGERSVLMPSPPSDGQPCPIQGPGACGPGREPLDQTWPKGKGPSALGAVDDDTCRHSA